MLLWGSIFTIIAAVCMIMSRSFDRKKRVLMISLQFTTSFLLLMDAVAWAVRGYPGVKGYYLVLVSNFCVFVLSDLILALYNAYMNTYLFEKGVPKAARLRYYAVFALAVAGVVMNIISQFNKMYYYIDADNFYHRNSLHFISMLIPMTGMFIDLSLIIQYRKNISRQMMTAMLSYMALPMIMTGIQIFYYGISLINISISISMIFMLIVSVIEQNGNLARKQKEAADLKISLMMSQIAPHFIYNTLAAIKQMCVTDPQAAQEMVGEFSAYLRINLETMGTNELIPFEKELEHTANYLSIEKRRFGDRVKVEYDIRDTEFMLPALTLQPIVENAVKHGICKKAGGGTVSISTYFNDNTDYIVVEDDGAGFGAHLDNGNGDIIDVDSVIGGKNDGRVHVGIRNVKIRLGEQCGGKLLVAERPGGGTIVTISIPRENYDISGEEQ